MSRSPSSSLARSASNRGAGAGCAGAVGSAGGVVGKITKLGEQYVTVEVAPNTELVVQRSAVQVPLPKGTLKTLQ